MNLISKIYDIEKNLDLFEYYLCEGNEDQQRFAIELIQRGSCFIAYEINREIRFAPSRYIGYKNNSIDLHRNNPSKDGRKTNPAITKVVGIALEKNKFLEKEFLKFTSSLGIKPNNKKRKYWSNENPIKSNNIKDDSINEFPEGALVERKHLYRERNKRLINLAKKKYFDQNNHLNCFCCGFNFEEMYGERGKGFIEAHHTKPISEMKLGESTDIEDIALVCSNCHKILHRTRPWLTIEQIGSLIQAKTKT